MTRDKWAAAGSLASAAASSACCWLPLLMVATGFSAAGVSAFSENFRPLFLVVAAILLGVGFYLNYRPQSAVCSADGTCLPTSSRSRRSNRGVLWISAVLVVAFALFPGYVSRMAGASPTPPEEGQSRVLVLGIEGMTCTGCETAVETALLELPEVISAEVSYDRSEGLVHLAHGAHPTELALRTAVGKAGYTLTSASEAVTPRDAHRQ